jgi:hypothetical protein
VYAGVPIKWRGRSGGLRWEAAGDLGVNWFREDPMVYFPRNPDLQGMRASLMSPAGTPVESGYPGQSSLALAADAVVRGSYRISSHMEAGFQAAFRRANWFQETVGGVFVRSTFRGKTIARGTEF